MCLGELKPLIQKKRFFTTLIVSLVSALSVWFWYYGAEQNSLFFEGESIAKVTSTSDQVYKRPAKRLLWLPIIKGQKLYNGETVKTEAQSQAIITFDSNQSKLKIEPDTLVVIRQNDLDIEINLIEGALQNEQTQDDNQKGDGRITIKSDQSIIDISKSEAHIQKSKQQALSLSVLKGQAKFVDQNNIDTQINKGESLKVDENKKTIKLRTIDIVSHLNNQSYFVFNENINFELGPLENKKGLELWSGQSPTALKKNKITISNDNKFSIKWKDSSEWFEVKQFENNILVGQSPVYHFIFKPTFLAKIVSPDFSKSIEPSDKIKVAWDRSEGIKEYQLKVFEKISSVIGNTESQSSESTSSESASSEKVKSETNNLDVKFKPYFQKKYLNNQFDDVISLLGEGEYQLVLDVLYQDQTNWIKSDEKNLVVKKYRPPPVIAPKLSWVNLNQLKEQIYPLKPELKIDLQITKGSEAIEDIDVLISQIKNKSEIVKQKIAYKDENKLSLKYSVKEFEMYLAKVLIKTQVNQYEFEQAFEVKKTPLLAPLQWKSENSLFAASLEGNLKIEWQAQEGAKTFEVKLIKDSGEVQIFKDILSPDYQLSALLPGGYQVYISSIDEWGRYNQKPLKGLITVSDQSQIKAPTIKKVKIGGER